MLRTLFALLLLAGPVLAQPAVKPGAPAPLAPPMQDRNILLRNNSQSFVVFLLNFH